jgi:hypothetical protein
MIKTIEVYTFFQTSNKNIYFIIHQVWSIFFNDIPSIKYDFSGIG